MRRLLALFTGLGLLLTPIATRAQIVNGGFEPATGSIGYALLGPGSTLIPGWITTDNGVEWHHVVPVSPAGGDAVDLACYVYSAGGLQQSIPTVVGQTYTVDFWLGTLAGAGRDGTCEVVVSAGAVSQTFAAANLTGTIQWFPRTFTFTATSVSTLLRFRCLQNANVHFAYIDGAAMGAVTGVTGSSWGRLKQLFR